MFDSLSDKLHGIFAKLRGNSVITESNIEEALREIKLALLEADVNVTVAGDFINAVRNESIGRQVTASVTPGQMMVKIVNDKLTELLGEDDSELKLENKPSVIMLVGLHGSGKTTSAGKLARLLKKSGKSVRLVAGDVYRPAAIDQLEIIGKEIDVPVHVERTSVNVAAIAANALEQARAAGTDIVIIDTAGRLQIDETMVQELIRLRQTVHPDEVLLVADAALGQEAVSVAEHFHKALDLSGLILTKPDGDARGGAALSIRKVTGVPIKFAGTGEKLDALEVFHPDRMAGRILGMGDVVSLVERASEKIDEEEAKKIKEKLRRNAFDYNDFLSQFKQIKKLGGMESVLKFLPGGRQLTDAMNSVDKRQFDRMEAVILSMTKAERENPDLMDFSRKRRIAKGAGVPVEIVGGLVKQFETMRKNLRRNGALGRLMSGGMSEETVNTPTSWMNAPQALSRKEQEHRKRLAKLARKQRAKQRRKK